MKKEILNFYLRVGAKNLNLSEKFVEFLEKGDAELKFYIPFEKKKGELVKIPVEFFFASRVKGKYFGEINLKEDMDDIESVGFLNTFSNSLFDLPFGGMCASIGINEEEYSVWEKKIIYEIVFDKIFALKEFRDFFITPGKGVNSESVMLMADALSKRGYEISATIGGKPADLMGLENFEDIFSEVLTFAIQTMLEDDGDDLKNKRVTFYGFDRYSDILMEKIYSKGIKNFIVDFEDVNFFRVSEDIKSKFFPLSKDEIISYESDIFIISETAGKITKDKADFINSRYIVELKPFSILPDAEEAISRRNINLLPDIFTKGILNLIYFEEYKKGIREVKTQDIVLNVKRKFIEVYRDTLGIGVAKGLSLKKTSYMIALGKLMKLISIKGL